MSAYIPGEGLIARLERHLREARIERDEARNMMRELHDMWESLTDDLKRDAIEFYIPDGADAVIERVRELMR